MYSQLIRTHTHTHTHTHTQLHTPHTHTHARTHIHTPHTLTTGGTDTEVTTRQDEGIPDLTKTDHTLATLLQSIFKLIIFIL